MPRINTAHYFQKRLTRLLFNESNYHRIKLIKIILDFYLNRQYEDIIPILPKLIKS